MLDWDCRFLIALQFRNETEVMGESKGDFLNAQVFLPNRVIKEECNIEFKLVPGKEDPAVEHPEIYPNLLYVKGAGPANAGAANDEVDDVRATSAAKRTQKRKRRETEKVMTNEDWRLHVKRTFTPDRTKDLLIALDREQKMHKTFTGETIIGQDVSTALDVIGNFYFAVSIKDQTIYNMHADIIRCRSCLS